MAKLLRDTARRSIEDLFKDLPANAEIEVSYNSSPPPAGIAAVVKIEITAQPRAKKGKPDADVPGQRGPTVGSGPKRRRPKAGQGSA